MRSLLHGAALSFDRGLASYPLRLCQESPSMRRMIVLRLIFFVFVLTTSAFSQDANEPIPVFSPMDALTKEEVQTAAEILRKTGMSDASTLYPAFTLLEPAKAIVRDWREGQPLPARQAFVVLSSKQRILEAIVDISAKKLVSFKARPGLRPIVLDANWTRARDAFKKDPRFKVALAKRGLKDDDHIICTPNSAGWFPGEDQGGRPILKVPCYSTTDKLHPSLARPIEGLMGVVDSETGEVLEFYDRESVALPPAPKGYGDDLPKQRSAAARVGFAVEGIGNLKLSGNLNVNWLDWRFHVRPDKRAGMIMSLVQFNDGNTWRDMAYQMNVSEMFVPYMDPDPTWSYRAFMDAGEFGLGYLLSSMQPGVDCPETATFVDVTLPNDTGGTYIKERGLCIFERPTGDPAWRHYSAGRKAVLGEPQLELVVRHIPTLGNYDYVVDYVFTPQGNIKLRVGATGFDAIKSVAAADMDAETAKGDTAFGALIAPFTVAPNHDHYFNFRLDLDVDGTANTLSRDVFVAGPAAADSARKSLWTTKTQRFVKEGPVVSDHAAMSGQMLRVVNPNTTNNLKYHPSLWLNAQHDAQSILDPADPPQARAQFSTNQFWVTQYKPTELWAAGAYPNLNPRDEGLPEFVKDNEDVAEQDIVVWYTMGFRHVTRPEDFPILPTFWHEMTLRPVFFFDMDPSMTFNSGIRR
jgi:primary-amine oxidase